MTYRAPVAEQRLLMREVARIDALVDDLDLVDAVLEGAGQFAEGEFAPLSRIGDQVGARWDDGEVTMPDGFKAAYDAFVAGGWMGLSSPEKWGGQGMPLTLSAALMDNLNAANVGFALCPMLSIGAVEALEQHGSAELQEAYLPKIVSGEWPATMNLTEPQAGSDVGALKTKAEPLGDGRWAIKGTKIFITYGEHDLAEQIVHLVLARTPGSPQGTRGISLFLVPKILPDGSRNDLRCVSIEHKMGIHASPTCVMSYVDEDGAIGWLVGAENAGMKAMFTMMNNARLNVGLQGVGIAEAATQRAVAYAMERKQGGSAIADYPDVKRMLLRMRALTTASRALCYYAFSQMDLGVRGDAVAARRAEVLTPMAKAWGTDVGVEVASLGIQVHGGMGFIEETGAAQHYRDARIAPIYEGTNGIQAADLVGRKLGLDGGLAFDGLVADMAAEAEHPALVALIDVMQTAALGLRESDHANRLAGSYPFLTLCSVAVGGWLIERAAKSPDADARLKASADYFCTAIAAEAMGLGAAVRMGAAPLDAVSADALA